MKLGAKMPLGPLALLALVGLDVALAAAESLYPATPSSGPTASTPIRACRKSGEGFYCYDG